MSVCLWMVPQVGVAGGTWMYDHRPVAYWGILAKAGARWGRVLFLFLSTEAHFWLDATIDSLSTVASCLVVVFV